MLLLASAVLLPIGASSTLADEDDKNCVSGYCYYDEYFVDLTLAEQQQLNALKVQLGNG